MRTLIPGFLMIAILAIAISNTNKVYSQSQFGFNTTTPDASAVMEIVDTTRGLLIPRMSTSDKTGIASPATGLLVYDNTLNKFYYYNGTAWTGIDDKWDRTGTYVHNTTDSIGIGTASPLFKLHVTDDINVDSAKGLRINSELFLHNKGSSIVAVGVGAGNSITVGDENVFVGSLSGYSTTTGNGNVFIGKSTGYFDTTGRANVLIGNNAGRSNNADNNTLIGFFSGWLNTTGSSNVFLGYATGQDNTTGSNNTFIGKAAGDGNTTANGNTFLGSITGFKTTTGYNNLFAGYAAGYSNTEGIGNTFIGNSAGYNNITADNNVFVGDRSGYFNTTGIENTFLGYLSGYLISTGSQNTIVGNEAGINSTTSNINTFIGFHSGRTNSTGYANTFLGDSSGITNSTGNNNTYIGRKADGSAALSNATAIGANASVTASNALVLGSGANVGIGTTAPSGLLHLESAGDVLALLVADNDNVTETDNPRLELRQDGATNICAIGMVGAAGSVYSGSLEDAMYVMSDDFNPLHFGTNSLIRMTIKSAGKVGIGTTSPGTVLDVEASGAVVATFNRTASDGTIIRLKQAGTTEGTISVSGSTMSYNNFTGSHFGWVDEDVERGMLLVMTGDNRFYHGTPGSELIYGVKPSSKPNDPAVLGAYLSLLEPDLATGSENPHLVMAVGNGDMWVANNGQDILPGDLLITSNVKGHAMKDTGEFEVSYIVARAAERVEWSEIEDVIDGTKHVKISVLLDSFVKTNYDAQMKSLLKKIDDLNSIVDDLQSDSHVSTDY